MVSVVNDARQRLTGEAPAVVALDLYHHIN